MSVGRRWAYRSHAEFLVSFTSMVVDGAYQLVKSRRILPSTPKYFGVVGTLPVKTPRGGPGERQEAGSVAAAWGNHTRVMDGLQHHDPGPALSARAVGRARPRQENRQERMGERRPPTSAFLPDLFLFVFFLLL